MVGNSSHHKGLNRDDLARGVLKGNSGHEVEDRLEVVQLGGGAARGG